MTSGEVHFSTPVPLWAWLVAGVAWPAAGTTAAVLVSGISDLRYVTTMALGLAAFGLALLAFARWVRVIVDLDERVVRVRPGGPRSMRVPIDEIRYLRRLETRAEVRETRNRLFWAATRRHLPVWVDQAVVFIAPHRPGEGPREHALAGDDLERLVELLGGERDELFDLPEEQPPVTDDPRPRRFADPELLASPSSDPARWEQRPPPVPAPTTPFTTRSSVPWWVWLRTVVLWGLGSFVVLVLCLSALGVLDDQGGWPFLAAPVGVAVGIWRLRRDHPMTITVDADGLTVNGQHRADLTDVVDVITVRGRTQVRDVRKHTTALRPRRVLRRWVKHAALVTSAPDRDPKALRRQHLLVVDGPEELDGLVAALGGARMIGPHGGPGHGAGITWSTP
jgi:hypothetical protein